MATRKTEVLTVRRIQPWKISQLLPIVLPAALGIWGIFMILDSNIFGGVTFAILGLGLAATAFIITLRRKHRSTVFATLHQIYNDQAQSADGKFVLKAWLRQPLAEKWGKDKMTEDSQNSVTLEQVNRVEYSEFYGTPILTFTEAKREAVVPVIAFTDDLVRYINEAVPHDAIWKRSDTAVKVSRVLKTNGPAE